MLSSRLVPVEVPMPHSLKRVEAKSSMSIRAPPYCAIESMATTTSRGCWSADSCRAISWIFSSSSGGDDVREIGLAG